MEEDLILLGMNIRKDPKTYREEYLAQLKILESLLNLPTIPVKQVKPMIFFIVKYSHVEPVRAVNTLINSLEQINDYLTKRVVLNGLVIVRQKRLLESKDLLRLIITHGNDLRYFLKSAQEFLDVNCYSILKDWYSKGTERQKSFCYFLLLVLFSKIHDVIDRKAMERNMVELDVNEEEEEFEAEEEIEESDECDSQEQSDESIQAEEIIAESSDEEMTEEEKPKVNFARDTARFSNHSNAVDLDELEKIICEAFFISGRLSKICCLYFLNRTEVKFDISKIKKGAEQGKKIFKDLASIMDRDIKIMKLKIFTLFKRTFNIKKSIVKMIVKMINLENEDIKELLDCLVLSVDFTELEEVFKMIADELVYEGQQEDIVVLGINVYREIFSKFLFQESLEEETLEQLKDKIFEYVKPFQGNRAKAIFYSYKMLLKVLIKREKVETSVSKIKRRTTKEEMDTMRKKGREEVKRLRAEVKREEDQEKYKKKRKGRKQTTMAKYMMKPTKRKGLKKKQKSK